MRRLLRYLLRYRWRYLAGAVCLLATASLAMAVPYLLKGAIDAASHGAPAQRITAYALSIIAIAAVQAIARTLSRALIFNVGRDVEYDLRNDLFAHLEKLPLAYYQEQQTGDLMSRLINDVTAVRMLLGVGILNFVNTPVYYAYGLAIMLALDVRLTIAALLPYPLLLLAVRGFSGRLMEHTLRVQQGLAEMSSRVQENLSGMHVVRAYASEERATAAFAALNQRFKDDSMRLAAIRGQMMPVMKTAASLGTLIVLWYGSMAVVERRISLGDLVAFIGYLNLLAWPTMALGWMLSVLQRGRAAMNRLEHIFAAQPAIQDAPDSIALTYESVDRPEPHPSRRSQEKGPPKGEREFPLADHIRTAHPEEPARCEREFSVDDLIRPVRPSEEPPSSGGVSKGACWRKSTLTELTGEVEFREVDFRYGTDGSRPPILKGISFRLRPGQVLALVGRTGAGKSTLAALLPRLFDVTAGQILLDGHDIRSLPLAQLRRSIGFVPQDPFLFSTTIRANVSFGREDASDDDIRRAASIAGLAEDIATFSRGYDTVVGERGITLSGGQKQRLTIARALLADPRILVLDDALSSVDIRTERAILSALEAVMRQRTSIVIAHRVSTILRADLIAVIDEGRLVEMGDHPTLLARGGAYAELFRQQHLEEEIAEL